MNLDRKKIILIPVGVVAGGRQADFAFNTDLLDKILHLNVSRICIITDTDTTFVRAKAVEFYVFTYCKTAVSIHKRGDGMVQEIMAMLPHNMRKADYFLSVGEKVEGVDSINMGDL